MVSVLSLQLFVAFSTSLPSYYGLKLSYLIGDSYWADLGFKLFFLAVVVGSSVELSSLVELSDVWSLSLRSELLGLYLLAPIIKRNF